MQPLRVHMPHEPDAAARAALAGALDPSVEVTFGELPSPARFEVLVAGVPDEALLDASPDLRAVVIPWAGLPVSTRERLMARAGLDVYNLHHNAPAAAEFAIALLLAAAKHLVPVDRALRAGDWSARYAPLASLALAGRRAVVLGHGEIGRRVAHTCAALGMLVTATRRGSGGPREGGVVCMEDVDLARLVDGAAALIVTLPLTDATRGLVDARVLGALASDAVVVNVGRGVIIDEHALHDALRAGRLGGAGLDVWYRYPENDRDVTGVAPSALPFHELDNVVMSPHRASAVGSGEPLRMLALAESLNALAAGGPVPHRVDVEAGY